MIKNKILRRLALAVSLIVMITSSVQTTFGLIVTQTDSLINTFTPFETALNDLLISKTVEHPLGEDYIIPEDISFDFKVELGSIYANTTVQTTSGDIKTDENGNLTVSVKPDKTVGINGIDADTKVKITELQKAGDGFAVKDGISVKEATVSDESVAKVDFVNVYTPSAVRPTVVKLIGTKTLEGRDWQVGDEFTFLLERNIGEDTWVSLGEKTVTYAEGNKDFNKLDLSDLLQSVEFDKVGTYAFRISEVEGNLENVDYDKTVNNFYIKIGDADMDGTLEVQNVTATENATVTADSKTGEYTVAVEFNNSFVPPAVPEPEDISVTVDIGKKVNNTGKQSIGPEDFEFILVNKTTGEKLSVKTDKNGDAAFSLPFTAADVGRTYNYTLSEVNAGRTGVTYDASSYDIGITISKNDENALGATLTMDDGEVEYLKAEFVNVYHNDNEPSPPTGIRTELTCWIIALILSSAVFAALLVADRRYKKING